MSGFGRVYSMLSDRVPLALWYDIAGFGPSSQELLRAERYNDADVARSLEELAGIGKVTALVITESLSGIEPNYLRRVSTLGETSVSEGARVLRAALQGDCHVHSDWSVGGSPIKEMA